MPMAEKLRLLRAGLLPLFIFFAMMVPFVNGWTSLVESSAIGAMTAFAGGGRERPDDPQGVRDLGAQDAWHFLHVHVDHPCRTCLRRGLRRAGRGQGDREPVHRKAGPHRPG